MRLAVPPPMLKVDLFGLRSVAARLFRSKNLLANSGFTFRRVDRVRRRDLIASLNWSGNDADPNIVDFYTKLCILHLIP